MADGTTLSPDVTIFATGYEPGLKTLLGGLDLLDRNGKPKHSVDRDSAEHPNLWFIGFTTTIYGNIYTRINETIRLADAIMEKSIAIR